MAIQYVDANADAVGTVNETFNISGSNDQFSIAVDGGGNQVFTLTHGSTQTVANIITDLTALTGASASAVSINGINFLRIRTTSASGISSTILVNAPSNNANATLGFIATTYNGGSVTNTYILGDTKQHIINNLETTLHTAGWITISGSGTTTLVMQSSMTPSPQNLRMRIRVKDNGNNCTVISVENVAGTKVGINGTGNGIQLLPANSKSFRILANKYQVFIFVPGSIASRDFGAFGVPYLPSWLQNGITYECIWSQGNATSDTDTGPANGGFRTVLQLDPNTGPHGLCQQIYNGNIWEGTSSQVAGNQQLAQTIGANTGRGAMWRWVDLTALMVDPIIGWGSTGAADETLFRGQLWNAFVSMEAYPIDFILNSVDSHNWSGITANNGAINSGNANSAGRGSLFVTVT